jgi:putative membrane protein
MARNARVRTSDIGEEPDVRFSFANERTFLAWNRTALAMMTAGLAITQLLPPFHVPGGRRMIGLPLIAVGLLISLASLLQWRRNERAMRLGKPLPASVLPPLVAIVVALSAVVAFVLVVSGGGGPS